MPCQILNRLGINASVKKIRDIGVPELVGRHFKINAIHQLGIVLLMTPQRWLDRTADALAIYIFIIDSLLGRTNHHILP